MSTQKAAALYTRAMFVMAAITLANLALGALLVTNPQYFFAGITAWAISLMVWFEIACRVLLDKGERPWN